eukprot:jgi/Chrpa1/25886/Chrysochromulina_OHIO_Genome00025760-RA
MGELERHDSPWTRVATSHSVTYAPVRKSNAYVRAMNNYVVDLFASIVAAARVLCAFDVFLSLAFTTTSTCLYWFLDMGAAVNISWTAVSFAIIIPITSGISLSFQRREKALAELGMLLGHLTSIWSCAHSWLVPSTRKEGGPKLVLLLDNFVEAPEQKREELRTLFDALLVALIAYLDAERWGRARNTIRCIGGDVEQCERMAIAHGSRMQFAGHMHRAFRAFTRVYLLLAGALYGPYFVELGLGNTGTERNLWFALLFACCTQLIFCGLYRSMLSLEDLFARRNSSMYANVDVI